MNDKHNRILHLDHIGHRYQPDTPVLEGFSLSVHSGEIVCLLGPSGCGKTTALRVVAGFERVDAGSVSIRGRQVADRKSSLPPEERHIGMVFQDAALFPHMTLAANIGFGLHKQSKQARTARVEELLELIDLVGYGDRYPHELSGGQQQRVALARAMAPEPELILLDEPFSNLDADLREKLGRDLRAVLKKSGATAVLVTHDQREAFVMADRIALMYQGQIRQIGAARDLYEHPADPFTAGFIGDGTLLRGTVDKEGRAETALGLLHLDGDNLQPGDTVDILIRPEQIAEHADGEAARVVDRIYRGADSRTTLELRDGSTMITNLTSETDNPRIGPIHPGQRFRAWVSTTGS